MRTWLAFLWVAISSVTACGDDDSSGGSFATGGAGGALPPSGGSGGSVLPPPANCPATVAPCVPDVLAPQQLGAGTLQVRGGYLYWRILPDFYGLATPGPYPPNSILRMQLPSGTPEVLTTLSGQGVGAIAVDATHVYFGTDLQLNRIPIAGGPVEPLLAMRTYTILIDDAYVYVTATSAPGLVRVPKAGGTAQPLVTDSAAGLLGLDATHAYYVVGTGVTTTELRRVPKAGGASESVGAVAPGVNRLLVAGGYAYLASGLSPDQGLTTTFTGSVYRLPVTGGVAEELASFDDVMAQYVEADADALYVSVCGNTGSRLIRLPQAGGAQQIIAQNLICPVGIAVDAERAYFTDWGTVGTATLTNDGTIEGVNRCGC